MTVVPSRNEGFGMVILEAMAQDNIVISFKDTLGPSQLIQHNKNGYLADYANAQSLAKYIDLAIQKKEHSENMIEASHQTLESYSRIKSIMLFILFSNKGLQFSELQSFYYNYINIDKINVQIQININKATLYFNVILSNSDSLPTCFTAAVAIAIDCGDISFAATPPTVFAPTSNGALVPICWATEA